MLGLGPLICGLLGHDPIGEIALIAHNDQDHALLFLFLLELLEPVVHGLEGFVIGDIVDEDGDAGVAIVAVVRAMGTVGPWPCIAIILPCPRGGSRSAGHSSG